MNNLLKGNFTVAKPVLDEPPAKSLEEQFESAALKRLGGSITFVAKKKVVWDLAPLPHGKTAK